MKEKFRQRKRFSIQWDERKANYTLLELLPAEFTWIKQPFRHTVPSECHYNSIIPPLNDK